MNGLFPFQFVGLVYWKHYGFEAVFLWITAEISHLNSQCASSQWRIAEVVSSLLQEQGAVLLGSYPIPTGQSSEVFCQEIPKLVEGNPEPPGCRTWECTSTAGSSGAVDAGRTELR